MKNILLEFAEIPSQENIDLSIVEYSSKLNLNVIRGTDIPAVTFTDEATETLTKSDGEGSDSDKNWESNLPLALHTSTETRAHGEQSDNDANNHLEILMSTQTQTFKRAEQSDEDRHLNDIQFLTLTRTLTESSEDTDSDK